MTDLLIIRILFVIILAVWDISFDRLFRRTARRLIGAVLGAGIVLFEMRLKQVSLKRLIGAAFGSVLGFLAHT